MKYLFFSHDGKLGDAIAHTALVSGIKSCDLNSRIDCTASGSTLDLWRGDERISEIFEIRSIGWLKAIKLGLELRKKNYDFIVIWNKPRSEKIRLILKITSPRKLIISEISADRHILSRENQALHQIFHCSIEYGFSIPNRTGEKLISSPILLNLFAGVFESKRSIKKEVAISLINKINSLLKDREIILCCQDHTEFIAQEVVAELHPLNKKLKVMNLSRSGVWGLIDLCAQSSLIISPDTSIVHIASALNKPIIAIYQAGESKTITWAPTSDLKKLIVSQKHDSIEGFDIADVANAVLEIDHILRLELS